MSDLPLDAEGLKALTDLEDVWAVAPILEDLEKDTELLLFIAPGCAVCPHQIRAAATVALASERVTLEIVDATQDQTLARRFEIGSVPTTIVDDDLVLVGLIRAPELARRLVAQQGPGAETMRFASLVEAGRHADAGQRLLDGRAIEAFAELWATSTLESRMGLMLAAEEALDRDPDALQELVPHLVAGLQGQGPLATDEARRGDTADLLGRIGHPDARPTLERLARDANAQVAEAARAALDDMGN